MPRLWTQNVESHRREVRDAILDATEELVAEHGLRAVTMGQIADRAGIGRATLYKYFPTVDAILVAWHERHVGGHLAHLRAVRDATDDPGERLHAVLAAYASHQHERSHARHAPDIAALVHHDEHVARAEQELRRLFRSVIAEAATAGVVRDDVAPGELAELCLHALAAAARLPSRAATRRLVEVTLTGLRG